MYRQTFVPSMIRNPLVGEASLDMRQTFLFGSDVIFCSGLGPTT